MKDDKAILSILGSKEFCTGSAAGCFLPLSIWVVTCAGSCKGVQPGHLLFRKWRLRAQTFLPHIPKINDIFVCE